MCGRISLGSTAAGISRYFDLDKPVPLDPRWNIAPGQNILSVRAADQDQRSAHLLHWGLIPSWAKDPTISYKLINARAETILEKPSFQPAFKARRCLIPADGFYEWQKTGEKKQPYHIRKTTSELFAFAGIWESWTDPQDRYTMESCAILTTAANSLLKPIHERMPVIVARKDFDRWLRDDYKLLGELLLPYEWSGFEAVPVAEYVNNARNEGVQCTMAI